jgi:uncharacterized protein YbjT (DUF2867 family)
MDEKRLIITGATGMVGGCALRICLENPDVGMVTVVGRRNTGLKHAKLSEILHDNFVDCTEIADSLKDYDVALYCLGVYTGAVPDDEFRRFTLEYTLAFAEALFEESPEAAFCFLSGQGADQTEQSGVAFARYKGAADKALLEVGFPRVHIFRPGYIYPVTPRKEPNLMYTITRFLYPLLRRFYPNIGISSEDLAQAMANVGLDENLWNKTSVLENRDIRELVNQ